MTTNSRIYSRVSIKDRKDRSEKKLDLHPSSKGARILERI